MSELILYPVEDKHLHLLNFWLRKEHVIKWYNDADEWLNEIKARNTEFSFLHHYSIDYFIGDENFLRKGFGRAIVGELVKMIRSQNSESKIVVQPDSDNLSSANVLIANGFTYDASCKYYIL